MNQELMRVFQNEKFGNVRVVLINSKEHFIATDVAKALGYVNPNKAINDHCRWVTKREVPHPQSNNKTLEVNVIPEGDLYRLITNSELPAAEEFEHWVFDEVLPSLRRHGAYMMDNVLEKAIKDPDFMIGLLLEMKKEKEEKKVLQFENAQQKQIIGELQPKATYYDLILQSKQIMPIKLIAKDYGMSSQEMNQLLHRLGIQYYQSGVWLLYAKYHHNGYTQSKTQNITHKDGTPGSRLHTQWTQKGRLFIYELLKREGILPMIEKKDEKVG